jgi:serine/threonine protein kinase
VALKMLLGGGLVAAESRERFQTRRRRSPDCNPNIVQIHDVGFHDGQPYLALEFVGGGNLADCLQGNPSHHETRRRSLKPWPVPCSTPTSAASSTAT